MTEIKRVKINDILESQIPEFLNEESPLFQEFLKQYFISQEHQTGVKDIAENIQEYKKIKNFNNETLIDSGFPSRLVSSILSFDDTIYVSHTIGFPDKYGLLKIDNEIITYTSKGYTTLGSSVVGVFYGCVRGFSGIDNIGNDDNILNTLNFSVTEAEAHVQNSIVNNLNYQFFSLFFKKFKAQFLPGFEERNLNPKISIQNILTRAKDFYISKGTDQSFKILFSVLYDSDIDVLKPQDYILSPSSNNYFKTNNILVEKISGGDPLNLKGQTLYQNVSGFGTASAAIYNVEYRPIGKKDLYEISLDSTSFLGNFKTTKYTKVTEDIYPSFNFISVDSTVGFANSSTIYAKTENSEFIKINYTDKTNNQFLNISGLSTSLYSEIEIYEDNFAYSYDETKETKLRILNVIDDINFDQTFGLSNGDKISLNSFGKDLSKNVKFSNWIYNIPTYHNISSIQQISLNTYRINLYDGVQLIKEQKVILSGANVTDIEATIITIENSNQFVCISDSELDVTKVKKVKRKLEKSNSNYFETASDIISNIHNTYIDKEEKYLYVTSSGFPNYEFTSKDTKVNVITGSASTTFLNAQNHNFLTGEKVYYQPAFNTSGISTGVYFVTKVSNDLLKLSYSNTDVFSKTYINFGANSSDYLYRLGYENKTIKNQKLLKKINLSSIPDYFYSKKDRTTFNRSVGILINGVEIYSPTLYDENIYYGKINEIEVTNPGSGFDVINYPILEIDDLTGSGCVAYPIFSGHLDSVKILSPGIGYDRKPKITLVGGNGSGAVLESNLVKSQIQAFFRADLNGVNTSTETITFTNNHNFDDGEGVIYYSNGNANVPGLIDKSYYYVQVLNPTQVKLYNNVGLTSAVNITGISSGTQEIRTLSSKNTITKVYVKNPGSGYSNRFVKVSSLDYPSIDYQISGISTADNYIFAKNHGFKNGDYVVYNFSDASISGLSSSIQYQVTVVDENRFKLSDAGIGLTASNINYLNKKYINIDSLGIGTHTFSYPEIRIIVESTSGIGSTSIVSPVLQPIVLGSAESVYIENGGVGYGVSDIINYHRRPEIKIKPVSSAVLKPIIIGGKINDVQIIYGGNGYDNGTEIEIFGSGKYADIQPIVQDGKISQVIIANSGVGYGVSNTTLNAKKRGENINLLANVFEWKINQIERNKNILSSYGGDDETVTRPNNDNSLGLGVINFYVPKKIRKVVSDNIQDTNLEKSEDLKHSPILGWAHDGYPIYGPYGYESLDSKNIKQIASSYSKKSLVSNDLRPGSFSNGFFVQDYVYNNNQDLDEYNGRYCITPEYPYGTYAYFATFETNRNPLEPAFPYVVGNYFKGLPIEDNFNPSFSQNLNLENLDLTRNVGNYYLNSENSGYEILDKIDPELKQEYIVDLTKKSGITSIFIDNPGDLYSVNDIIKFESVKSGLGANARVSRIKGKNILSMSVGISSFYDVNLVSDGGAILGITSIPHNLVSNDYVIVSGISTSSLSQLNGTKRIYIYEKTTGLTTSLLGTPTTGIVTSLIVNDTFGFEINDSIGIGTEIATIVDVIPKRSTLIIRRNTFTGIHTSGIDDVRLLSKKIRFLDLDPIKYTLPKNITVYFDPNNTIGYGTTGSNYSVVGVGTSSSVNRFIPSKSIYVPDHNFYTGQPLRYNYSSGIGISVYNSNSFSLAQNQTIYAVNLGTNYLGISTLGFTTSSGIGTSLNSLLLYFDSNVIGIHSFTTTNSAVTARVENYSGIVTTSIPHNLTTNDKIRLNLFPSRNESVKFRFDYKNRKITTDLIGFSSSFVSTNSSSKIYLENNNFKTGDKIIYYSGSSAISGLNDGEVYYIIKYDSNNIQLCDSLYDTTLNNYIPFASSGIGTHNIAPINPPLYFSQGNIIFFDTSDSSLTNLRLDFYTDPYFQNKFEIDQKVSNELSLIRSNTGITLKTQSRNVPSVLYYKFSSTSLTDTFAVQISEDIEIIGNNKISFNPSILSSENNIISIGNTTFKFNLKKKPEYSSYTTSNGISSIFYDTDSLTATGPISQIKITAKGKAYSNIPGILSIGSTTGNDASIFASSTEIGKVLTFNRIKEGFNYLTDPTLSAQMSVPAVCVVKGISRIKSVEILTGGKNYNTPPRLKVIGNDSIKLSASIQGGSVTKVNIDQNSSSLDQSLKIIPFNNSNGYLIDDIYPIDNNGTIRVELLYDPITYPLINTGYGSSESVFPFSIGDQVFVEKCRITSGISTLSNYNSIAYGFNFFTVVGVDSGNYTVDYSMNGLQSGTFGTYNNLITLGSIVNKKDMPEFEMKLINDAKYYSGELVTSGSKFSAVVMQNGWSNNTNQLKLIDCKGTLDPGDKLLGKTSKLNGTVKFISKFSLPTHYGSSREKINQFSDNAGHLNDFQQKLSDNNYYQKFSYSIRGEVPYSTWKEAVKSIIHPSGFKEFSDLVISGIVTDGPVNLGIAKSTSMKVSIASSEPSLLVNIDNVESLSTKHNFSMVYEDDQLEDGSVERIYFPQGVALKPYILNKTNKVTKIDDISLQFTGITSTLGGSIVGISSFKLTSKGNPLFYQQFVGSATTIIDLENDRFNITNHGFQSGQKVIYNVGSGTSVGIATTSIAEGPLDIIVQVGAGIGSAIYENGYNNYVPYTGSIGGISSTLSPPGVAVQYFGYGNPLPGIVTTGIGTGAKFQVLITYDKTTGIPIGTSIQLVDGGSGYSVGQKVSIAGTYMNGTTPANDLFFTISRLSNTRAGTANDTYTSVASTTTGSGSGAIFTITRDSNRDIKSATVVNGGSGYELTDQVIIAGANIGGSTPADNLYLSPVVLGTNKLPPTSYIRKINPNSFQLCGFSTTLSTPFDLISYGSGNQSISASNPNESVIISIDNIIQSPLHRKNINIGLATSVGVGTTTIYVTSGINSITTLDIIKIDNEYYKINTIGIGSTNAITVTSGFMGSASVAHTVGASVAVLVGDFNIVDDSIYFSDPPFGPAIASSDPQFKLGSSFAGRVFSRAFDSTYPNDKNLIIDDISVDFTGIAATQFTLKSNQENVVGLYTNRNYSTDISNNPIVLINNVFQVPETDYTIDNLNGSNTIRFLSGTPSAGKIVNVAITTGFGYQPLIGAAATISVSAAGTINSVTLKGSGSGYRTAPNISIASTIGYGATISATIGSGGTVTSFTIINGGIGYTSTSLPIVNVEIPSGYSNLGIAYTEGSSGSGQNAKVSIQVGSASSIIQFLIDDPGIGYKVGDILKVVGLTTNPTVGAGLSEFRIKVTEVFTDKFSAFYPGQFILFDGFSQYFNGRRTKFTMTQTISGVTNVIDLKKSVGSDIELDNNIFVFLNDILQVPGESYTFSGTRIIFNEPPKPNSKCSVIFFRGSSVDVEEVTPPSTIKMGDAVQIGQNINVQTVASQFERIVKTIVTSDQIDTFNYDSIGINIDTNLLRPIKWTKQTQDRIINGSLISKSRPSLISTILPSTRIIKNVSPTDDVIYVSNAFPLFSALDSLAQSDRSLTIYENKETSNAIGTAIVSTASTISFIAISSGGSGYAATTSPKVAISTSQIKLKDPIFNWYGISGIQTNSNLNSIVYGSPIVSVGSSGYVAISTDGKIFSNGPRIGYAVSFNSVGLGSTNYYISVSNNGNIVQSVGFGTTISSWSSIPKYTGISTFGITTLYSNNSTNDLNEMQYSQSRNRWICVGAGGTIFTAVGFTTTFFLLSQSGINQNLNSVAFGDGLIVAVGDNGYICISSNGATWSAYQITSFNLNHVTWDGSKFVIVGSNSTILYSNESRLLNDGGDWTAVTANISGTFTSIKYNSNYNFYILLLDGSNSIYYSLDLQNWSLRSTNQSNIINDFVFLPQLQSFSIVGNGVTAAYSVPDYNFAVANSNAISGIVTSVIISNPGFGYDKNNPPLVLIEPEPTKTEKIISYKADGDFGLIVGMDTSLSIGSTIPKIKFNLKSESYDNINLGIGYSSLNELTNSNGSFVTYSGISTGDYFIIYDSNVQCGHALTGITTSNMEVVGVTSDFINGIYRVDSVGTPVSGIVTVTCAFLPGSGFANKISFITDPKTVTNGFYGKYSWGKIFGYQNRSLNSPKQFNVNTSNGLSGLSTSPEVIRSRGLFKSK
jgi:hypothetical protein